MHAVIQKAEKREHVDEISNQQLAHLRRQKSSRESSADASLRLVIFAHDDHVVAVQIDVASSLLIASRNHDQLESTRRQFETHVHQHRDQTKKNLIDV